MKMFDALCSSDKKLTKDNSKLINWIDDWDAVNDTKPSRYNALVHLLMNNVKPVNAIAIVANAYVDGRLTE